MVRSSAKIVSPHPKKGGEVGNELKSWIASPHYVGLATTEWVELQEYNTHSVVARNEVTKQPSCLKPLVSRM
jgi:hypothetical protein